MANWYGSSRTNYVRIKDEQALREALESWDIKVHQHPERRDFVMFEGAAEDGDFPSMAFDDDDNELEFSFEDTIVPHLVEGRVLLSQVIGNEKLRYLSGHATAYAWDGRTASISISDIHKLAAETFGVDPNSIAHPTYMDLPENLPPHEEGSSQEQAPDPDRPRSA